MKTYIMKAFTLVELLIVIGIIGILAVVLLVTLNPAEAQRKARDAKRIKDAGTLQVIMEQAIADNLIAAGTPITGSSGVNSGTARATQARCDMRTGSNNWLEFDVCSYVKSIPMEPLNGYTASMNDGTGGVEPIPNPKYKVRVVGIDYEINVRQESTGNTAKIKGDGGNSDKWFEIFSGANNLFTN